MTKKSTVTLICSLCIITGIILSWVYFKEDHKSKNKDVINIGVITSLTGTIAPYGKNVLNGLLLAKDEINNHGGINNKRINLIIEDDKSSTKDAVSSFNKLFTIDKVPLIIGPVGSTEAMVCAPIANLNKIVEFSPAASTPMYTTTGDYTFRNRSSAALEVEVMADIAYKNLNIRNIAILYINNDVGNSFYPYFINRFTKLGGKILITETFDQGSTDMRKQLSKIKKFSPDGLYFIGHVEESGYILKQIKELNIKTRLISHYSLEGKELFDIAGKAAEGIIYTAPGIEKQSVNPKYSAFAKKYLEKYGSDCDVFSATAYDALYILKIAIEKGGYNSEGIKNELYKINNFIGVTGMTSFDSNGDVVKPVVVKEIKNGEFVEIVNINDLK
ncbi:MAG: penicillin-binding protein activator [Ignavibacteriae bacterium]|nr:penicillin-binding protein activator [Ignavibacteriota bacterium]